MKRIMEKDHAGMTVKEYITAELPGLSRRILIEMKKRPDGILLNGRHATVRAILAEGDELTLHFEDERSSDLLPSSLIPEILYEDDDLLAVNKPAGIPTHPSHDHPTDTLANAVVSYYQAKGIPFVFRVINRLDSVTSGVVMIAKNPLSAARLSASLVKGQFEKHYLALVEGVMVEDEGRIERHIIRRLPSIIERTVCEDHEGEYALTTYRVLKRSDSHTLLDCFPHTGRTHQLRVHLSSIGHPIAGDFLYGKESELLPGRTALHCYRMTFPHPTTGSQFTVVAPPDNLLTRLFPPMSTWKENPS